MKKKTGKLIRVLLCVCVISACYYGYDKAAVNKTAYCGDRNFVTKVKTVTGSEEKSQKTSGRTYYVSVSGKDTWSGTKKKPFGSFGYALSRLQKGDTLYIRGGVYQEQLLLPKTLKGTASAYIKISSMPGETAVLDGSSKKSPVLVQINGASYIEISGLELKNADGQDACGILVNAGSNHLILKENRIHRITVPQPEEEDHCANGILLFGDSAENAIHDILIYKNKLYDCQTGWAECISVTANARNINLISNTITNTGNIGIDLSGNYGYCSKASVDFPRNCLIYGNKVTKCISQYATSYGIYVDGGQEITIARNTVQQCSGGIEIGAEQKAPKDTYATAQIVVKNNTISDNTENAITIGGYAKKLGWVKQVQIRGNRCKNNGKENAILTLAKCKDITITGNQFWNGSGNAAIVYSEFSNKYTKNIVFQKNTYYNGHAKNNTEFVYLGKTYPSFSKWNEKVGGNAGTYQK